MNQTLMTVDHKLDLASAHILKITLTFELVVALLPSVLEAKKSHRFCLRNRQVTTQK